MFYYKFKVWLLFINFDTVNIKFIKINRLVYLMVIRWAVCVWLQCDSILCEFTAMFNLLAIVIIIMFIINLSSFGWPFPTVFNSVVIFIYYFIDCFKCNNYLCMLYFINFNTYKLLLFLDWQY